MSEKLHRMVLRYDSDGYVIPPESFVSQSSKNYFARIDGRHPKYKWNRQWIRKHYPHPTGGPKYDKDSFLLGEVYEFHASQQVHSDEEIERKKSEVEPGHRWMVEKKSRTNSLYNGFWECTGRDEQGIRMRRVTIEEMRERFPPGFESDEYAKQTMLDDFLGT